MLEIILGIMIVSIVCVGPASIKTGLFYSPGGSYFRLVAPILTQAQRLLLCGTGNGFKQHTENYLMVRLRRSQ
jgi:hypothetical protein